MISFHMPLSPDFVIIGAGVFGTWTAYHLRAEGHSVLLVDAFGAGHSKSSSGGKTRIIRIGYGDKKLYSEWALNSLDKWKILSAEAKEALFNNTGVLWMNHDNHSYVNDTVKTLKALNVPIASLSATEVSTRYPAFSVEGISGAILEPASGVLLADRAITTLINRVTQNKVDYRVAAVESFQPTTKIDAVKLSDGTKVSAGAFIFACGPWLRRIFPNFLGPLLTITRQEVFFIQSRNNDQTATSMPMPAWIDFHEEIYGLPDIDGHGTKIGLTKLGPIFDPDHDDRTPSKDVQAASLLAASVRIPQFRHARVVDATVCQYSNTSTGHLIIDRHPYHQNVWLIGGGSGHGFKLGPAVGAHVASLVEGSSQPIPEFSIRTKNPEYEREIR